MLDLSAIEFAVSFDDVIVSSAFKDRLADERADLQSANTDFHHCDLRFPDLIGEHIWNLQGWFENRLLSIVQWPLSIGAETTNRAPPLELLWARRRRARSRNRSA